MELGAILLLLGVLVIVVLFITQPFTEHWRAKAQSGHEISALLAERERALSALEELDFDNKLGKVPAEEYSTQRARLLIRGADVLRKLDDIRRVQFPPMKEAVSPITVEHSAKAVSDEDLENLIAKRRAARQQKTGGFCPKCGKPIMQTDQFCSSCGQAISSM